MSTEHGANGDTTYDRTDGARHGSDGRVRTHEGRLAHDEDLPRDERLAREDRRSRAEREYADADVGSTRADDVVPVYTADRQAVVAAERERFGGVKVGSAFFGWLTAMGTAVILTALLVAAGTAVGLSNGTTASDAAVGASNDPGTVGIIGAIALGIILFVAYYCGGYVAGRMARFDGARQGVAVWVWALVVAVVIAVLGAVAGSKFDILSQVNGFPRIPLGEGELTTGGIIAAVIALVTSLIGAILGGLAGMRYHRRVDRAGLGD